MPEVDELTIPPAPRGFRREVKNEWRKMAKMMIDQGVNPASRFDLLEHFIEVVGEHFDLSLEWPEASLRDKIALSRRFSALLAAKLKLRAMLLAKASSPAR